MNILMTIASLDPATGGPARSVPLLSKQLVELGCNVQLFVSKYSCDRHTGIRELKGLTVKRVSSLLPTLHGFEKQKSGNTIIHNHGIWLPINRNAAVLATKTKTPLVNSPRGMLEPWARQYRSYKKMLAWVLYQRKNLSKTTVFHATAKQEAINIECLKFCKPIAIIPNGVEIPYDLVEELTPTQTKTVLFLSRIHPVKGLKNLIQAWHEVRPKDWKVVIAGPDENRHKAEIEREIAHFELSEEFSFTGPVDDHKKWQLYDQAELFILPSFSENFGIVVAEALGSGLPVISTKATPWAELQSEKCGWWIDVGVGPLAKAIREATSLSTGERFAMGQRGRELISRRYSWRGIAEEMSSVYEWILHKREVPKSVMGFLG